MEKITVLIADDHQLIRESLGLILSNDPQIEVQGLCGSAEEAVEKAMVCRPQIILLDINLPGISGIEAIPVFRKFCPGIKIVGMSMHTQPAYARKMMQTGASGFVTKNSSCEELLTAIREVRKGNRYVCAITRDLLSEQLFPSEETDKYNTLTSRELGIIEMIKTGLTSKMIGEKLAISTKTVEVHRYNILKKLGLSNTAALMSYVSQRNPVG
jgi:two-component system invasion response regulator UvrY